MTDSATFHKFIKAWESLGSFFSRHPVTIVCLVVGLIAVSMMSAVSFYQSEKLSQETMFQNTQRCEGTAPYSPTIRVNCRKLFDRILTDPSREQLELLNKLLDEAQ